MDKGATQEYLNFAKALAQEAGVIAKRYFRSQELGTEWKEDDTPLTAADNAINELVIASVKKTYPSHGVIGEEGSYEEEKETVWVVDPIDGTMLFSTGMPNFTFCLALVHKGEVRVSVVYDIMQDKLFSAVRGEGAFVNDQPLRVSKKSDFKNAYVMTFRSSREGLPSIIKTFDRLHDKGAKIMALPSYAYMAGLVAEGEFVAAYMAYGSPWDAAAISLIVEEAGGKASDLYGNKRTYNTWGDGILLSNGAVHNQIAEMVRHENNR